MKNLINVRNEIGNKFESNGVHRCAEKSTVANVYDDEGDV